MKKLGRLFGMVMAVGVVVVIIRAIRQYQQDSALDMTPGSSSNGGRSGGGKGRSISPELIDILADPEDKGKVELVVIDGKEWLVNRRNGNRYPVEDGIPIMLVEEGQKYRDESLIQTEE